MDDEPALIQRQDQGVVQQHLFVQYDPPLVSSQDMTQHELLELPDTDTVSARTVGPEALKLLDGPVDLLTVEV